MANDYFHFKQFTVNQNKCAMKVGTDGVLLGSWTNTGQAKSILDVGTGTGLIALMLAQKSAAHIDAVEIDEPAYAQACENVQSSPWPGRITIYKDSFQRFAGKAKKQYDIVLSNPPYFSKSLNPPDSQRNQARHDISLSFADLIENASLLLKKSGKLNLILPCPLHENLIKEAEKKGLFITRKWWIKPNKQKEPKRVLLEFSKTNKPLTDEKTLTIEKDKRHDYTKGYIELTKNFYLNF